MQLRGLTGRQRNNAPHLQPDDGVERQHMRPAQIVIRVRRRKSVEMRAADRGEQERLPGNNAVKARVDGHDSIITELFFVLVPVTFHVRFRFFS